MYSNVAGHYQNYSICRELKEKLSFIVGNYAKATNPHCTCANPDTPFCYKNYELRMDKL